MARNALKLFTMVGENFEMCISKMARKALKNVHHGWRKILKYVSLKLLEMPLNIPLWMEKNLKFVSLKWLEMH